MRYNWIYMILLLVASSCQQKNSIKFSGILRSSGQEKYQIFISDRNERINVPVDSLTGTFSIEIPADSSRFVHFSGIVENGDDKWPFMQTVYLQPGKDIHLAIEFKERKALLTVDAKDRNNQALIAYQTFESEKSRELWTETPPPESVPSFLLEIYDRAQKVVDDYDPGTDVVNYLDICKYVAYHKALDGIGYIYSRDTSRSLPGNLKENIPPSNEVLDNPMALLFDNTVGIIQDELRREADTPEKRLQLLKQHFKCPEIIQSVSIAVVETYVAGYNFNEHFDEGLRRLQVMVQDMPDKAKGLVQEFENKRFSVEGAPLPDVVLEDPDGNKVKLSDFKGKYLYIDLWASWCVPCCQEVPFLQKLEKQMKDNDRVVFISISLDENKEAWKKRMQKLDMHGNQFVITNNELSEKLNVKGIPHFLLYDKEGKLMQYKAERPSAGNRLKDMLDQLR